MSSELPSFQPPAAPASTDPVEQVMHYHIRTKHHYNRYARSLGFLDWANQPDPLRRFHGAPLVRLPLLKPDEEPLSPAYDAMYRRGAVPSQSLTLKTLSRFFELASWLSAWKRAGESEWALRNNPSSGNLHPTEGYVLLPPIDGLDLATGLYHYAPKEHGLELSADFPSRDIARLLAAFPPGAFLFGLTSVFWREAWKYGERAFRYCNHDVGHAIGSARIAAATLGWRMVLLDGVDQNTAAMLLGTHRTADFGEAEPEHPDCLAVVWPCENVKRAASLVKRDMADLPLFLDPTLVKDLSPASWYGKANRLTHEHAVHWDIIDEAAEASWKTEVEHRAIQLVQSSVPSATLHARRWGDYQAAAQCSLLRCPHVDLGGNILSEPASGHPAARDTAARPI